MSIRLFPLDALGTSGRLSGISSASESDSSKTGKLSGGTGWRLRRGARTEERGQVFLSVRFLFGVILRTFPKGMADLERANKESVASTMASNQNKSGYSVTQKNVPSLSRSLIDVLKKLKTSLDAEFYSPSSDVFFFLTHFQINKSVAKKTIFPNIQYRGNASTKTPNLVQYKGSDEPQNYQLPCEARSF